MSYFFIALLMALATFFIGWRKGNEALAVTISVVWGLIAWWILYGGMLVISPWGFHGIWVLITLTFVWGGLVSLSEDEPSILRWIPTFIALFLFCVMVVTTWSAFQHERYRDLLGVKSENIIVGDSLFAANFQPVPVEKMRVVSYSYAQLLAGDELGGDPGLSSRMQIGKMTEQNITAEFTINGGKTLKFENSFIWIAPLEHTSYFKWINNGKSHNLKTTGYVIVDATNWQNVYLVTEVNGKPLRMLYLESSWFSMNVKRHARLNGYLGQGIADSRFQIDENGQPHTVYAHYEKTIGFGGSNTIGAVVVNSQTGEIQRYSIENAPAWVDRIQPEDFIEDQLSDWAKFRGGWWNSFLAEDGVEKTTAGSMVVVSSGNKSLWYTGIRGTKTTDDATTGFALIDTRTKEVTIYRRQGIDENAAKVVAEDIQETRQARYSATTPIMYNIHGVPTYFMTMKGERNIMGYVFVSAISRQTVGYGVSKQDALRAYIRSLTGNSGDQSIKDGPLTAIEAREYVVRAITLVGDNFYLLLEGQPGKEFYGPSMFFRDLKWTDKGHKVSMSYGVGESDLISIDFFENKSFKP